MTARRPGKVGQLLPDDSLNVDDADALASSFGFNIRQARDLSCPFVTKPAEAPTQPVQNSAHRPRRAAR
jgi:hypothetical protein